MLNKNLLLFFLTVLIVSSFVSATDYYRQGDGMDLRISCDLINCSDGNVNITVLDPNKNIIVNNQTTTKYNGYVLYNLDLALSGSYSSFIASDNYFATYNFVVTESGVEITRSSSNLTIGLLAILVLFFFGSLFIMFNVKNYIAKFSLYWATHLLLILISFVGWQVGVEGLLIGTALTGIFRILFWIFIVSVFPMVLLSVAWVVYIHLFNEHFQKLIDKGEDPETAFSLSRSTRDELPNTN